MRAKHFIIHVEPNQLVNDMSELNCFLSKVKVINQSVQLIESGQDGPYWALVLFYETAAPPHKEPKPTNAKEKLYFDRNTPLTLKEQEAFNKLYRWRAEKARQATQPTFCICSKAELITIAKTHPHNNEDLVKIKGFNELKTKKYGEEIIGILNAIAV